MKKIKNILVWPFKAVKNLIVFALEFISTIILAIGSLVYALAFVIKDYKIAKVVLKELTKKIFDNGTTGND